jgi:hypothetical protein
MKKRGVHENAISSQNTYSHVTTKIRFRVFVATVGGRASFTKCKQEKKVVT